MEDYGSTVQKDGVVFELCLMDGQDFGRRNWGKGIEDMYLVCFVGRGDSNEFSPGSLG